MRSSLMLPETRWLPVVTDTDFSVPLATVTTTCSRGATLFASAAGVIVISVPPAVGLEPGAAPGSDQLTLDG
ncbi:hypothetical protein AB0J86_10935 [Micromonospora sp. NPDC049559]|uniref:hypothetical protein n=1 Tax=Micromonospora sp. NPDC049559 TaxID=3155923 RepID=UPI00343921E1